VKTEILFARRRWVKANEVLCALRIGWVVDAIPVADPLAWNGKHEIFCPVPEE
jgi:hypothetical protein